ncbi:short-chain dehydrogenase [Kordiimonas sediminis]|uniref:Short-chain dehydrogenase n=1 Tax=Kordiimonas sediminis TaxID=1735581 RepID=A0A919E951_9PROT|nr:SDR family NAD(P)-dependent oxidoreductase [Kordiimonas sediminis]GHF25255.1 short-chain dehydrogenase [Kordiimonas sediminis]
MTGRQSSENTGQTVALTGATGFLGSQLITSLVKAGLSVRALTRRPQADRENVYWVKGDLDDKDALLELCEGADCIIHCAGVTKALSRDAFFDCNVKGTKNLLQAAKSKKPTRFILVSSLAAREPQLSHYAASKAAAEMAVSSGHWPFRWAIVRPPAIYGPGDMEILKIFKALKVGILPVPGRKSNQFSMIHVEDMAEIICKMTAGGFGGQIIEPDDGKSGGYTMKEVALALSGDKKPPRLITIPSPLLKIFGILNGIVARLLRRPAIFTGQKARELAHSDWVSRSARKPHFDNWSPHYSLKEGLNTTLQWYRQNGFL